MGEDHTIMGGKVHVYRRENSRFWQCSTYLAGKNRRVSTKEDSLSRAKDFAEDWYLGLRGLQRSGTIVAEKTFKTAAQQFEREYEVITGGQRNPAYVEGHSSRLRNHLLPFFGAFGLSQITPGKVQEYRIQRLKAAEGYKPPARTTMHHEMVTLRQVLKTAIRHGWLAHLPDISVPYGSSGKITHRAWFSPEEYRSLYGTTRKQAQAAKGKAWQWAAEQLHDYVLFMANTGLRPDEANNLEYRDALIVKDDATSKTCAAFSFGEPSFRSGSRSAMRFSIAFSSGFVMRAISACVSTLIVSSFSFSGRDRRGLDGRRLALSIRRAAPALRAATFRGGVRSKSLFGGTCSHGAGEGAGMAPREGRERGRRRKGGLEDGE